MADDISDRKSPGFWFFTADFERDMQILPLAAQGLWIRMMCWASDNEAHRGFLELPTGEPMTDLDIAHRVGKPIKEVRAAIDAMRRLGTFSVDSRGCIFSRRMARDTHISEVRRQAAIRRAETARRAADGSFSSTPTSFRENEKSPRSEVAPQGEPRTVCPSESSKPTEFAPANNPAKHEQNPTVPDSDSVSVSTKEEEPPKPPAPTALVVVSSNGNGAHLKRRGVRRTTEEIRKALGEERGKWWDAFWQVFPCRDGMNAGMDAFERRVETRELAVEVFRGAQRYAKQYAADPTMKLKYPQGWINGERWKDENRIPPKMANGKVSQDELADMIEAFARTR